MKKQFLTNAAPKILLAALFGVFFALAQTGLAEENTSVTKGRKGYERSAKKELIQELGLSEEQEKQLAEYRKQNLETKKQIMENMKNFRIQLRKELTKPVSDTKEIERLKTEIKNAHNQMVDDQVNSILQMKQVLTPEQFKKFQDKIKERQEKMREIHEKFIEEHRKSNENPPPQPEDII